MRHAKFMLAHIVVGALLLFALTACTAGGDSLATVSTTAVGFKSVNSALDSMAKMIPSSMSAQLTPPAPSTAGVSPLRRVWSQSFLGNARDLNVAVRLQKALANTCAVASVLAAKNGGALPTEGTTKFSYDADAEILLKNYCGVQSADLPTAKASVRVTVQGVTNTSLYDQKLTVRWGNVTETMYLRVNSNAINVATADGAKRVVASLNRNTGVFRAEMISYSQSQNTGDFARLYFDKQSVTGAMAGGGFDFLSLPNRYVFTMKGQPEVEGAQIALSVGVVGYGLAAVENDASTTALNYYKGCISSATAVIAADDTLGCVGTTGTDASLENGLGARFTNFATDLQGNAAGMSDPTVFGEAHGVPFEDENDVFSAPIPLAI